MARFLVTGSAGFIGFHIATALLKRGDEVVGIDNMNPYYSIKLKEDRNSRLKRYDNYTFYRVDISKKDELNNVLNKEKLDVVCHLAAQAGVRFSLENPYIYEESNIRGFLNLVEWAKGKVENFVYASSSSVYGGNKKVPFSEDDRVEKPISLYAATKKADELIAHVYSHLYSLPTTGLRFFTVYGPWGRPDMALYKFALKIAKGEQIDVFGYGKMKRDFTYIEDMVPAVLNALNSPKEYMIYNLGGNNPVDLMYFISLIEKEFGVKAKKNFLPIQLGDVPETYADITRAEKDLGYKPKTGIEEGIKRFFRWFFEYHKSDLRL